MLSFKERANWTPAEARTQFRQNFFPFVQSGGIAAAYTQVSVHFVPSAEAKLFAEFCRLNHAPCPVVYTSEPGQVTAPPIAADLDIRTDQSAYGIFQSGVCVKTVPDILDIPFDDFVTFYLGCSHSFEHALSSADLPVRHQQVDRRVPSYKTKIPCLPVGPFWGNQVCSMRPMPRDLVQRAFEVTAVLDLTHGAPIHIGHPCWIGVKDLNHPEYDDKPNMLEGDVCLFWGCGTTAQEALANAELPLNISLSPSVTCCNLITDLVNENFNKMHVPKEGTLQPRVVFISEGFVFGSVLSDKAMKMIQHLAKLEKRDRLKDDNLAQVALRLSHATSVAIVTSGSVSTREGFSVLSIIKAAMATETREVVLLVPEEKCPEWLNAARRLFDLGLLKKPVPITKIEAHDTKTKADALKVSLPVLSKMKGFKLKGVNPHRYTALVGSNSEGELWVECAAVLMAEETSASHLVTETADSSWSGVVLAAALYTLNCCPVHSRYLRRGLGEHKPSQLGEFTMTAQKLATLMTEFDVSFEREKMEDLVKGTRSVLEDAEALAKPAC